MNIETLFGSAGNSALFNGCGPSEECPGGPDHHDCGIYRYELSRIWDLQLPIIGWMMLNQSKADATVDDPTIRRCMGFARRWGYGGIVVRNLFALRATDPRELQHHPDPMVELFAGPGGWSTGLRAAGYTGGAVGLEWDLPACRTAKAAGHSRICADVATYPTGLFASIDGLVASPPCQAWSVAGNRLAVEDQLRIYAHVAAVAKAGRWLAYQTTGWADDRSPLVLEVLRWVLEVRPRWFACEQVPDVLPLWRELARILRGHGYSATAYEVSAEEYGVPQTRRRAILTGSLVNSVAPPWPTHQRYVPGEPAQAGSPDLFGGYPVLPWVSMAEALGWGLPGRPSWTVTASGTDTGGAEVSGNAACRRRLAQIVYVNGNRQNAARRPADQPAPTVMFSERSNKVEWAYERPATTVCGGPRIGRPGHKDRDKGEAQFAEQSVRVTVAEAAILQGFPVDYPWQGTKSQQYRQVGDAVPPPLATAILRPLLTAGSRAAA